MTPNRTHADSGGGAKERLGWLSNLAGLVLLVIALVLFEPLGNRLTLESSRLLLGLFAVLGSGYFFVFRIDNDHRRILRTIVPIIVPLLVVMILLLLHYNTGAAFDLALEDGPMENMQAVFALIGAVVMAAAAVVGRRRVPGAATVILGLLAAGMFFVGMEEISWGQRIFDIETIGVLEERNRQGENTLHNLDSVTSDLIFYFLAFVLFVVLPFLAGRIVTAAARIARGDGRFANLFRRLNVTTTLRLVLPGRWLLLPFCLAVAITHDERHFYLDGVFMPPLYLVAIGITLVVLLRAVVESMDQGPRRIVHTLGTLVLFIATVFTTTYYQGREYSWKLWMTTEYRETIVTIGLLVYSFDTLVNINRYRRGATTAADPAPAPRPAVGPAAG